MSVPRRNAWPVYAFSMGMAERIRYHYPNRLRIGRTLCGRRWLDVAAGRLLYRVTRLRWDQAAKLGEACDLCNAHERVGAYQ